MLVKHVKEHGGFWQGKWICPGGELEYGETIAEGIKREVKMTDTGAVMTLTAKNSKKVKKLQDTAAEETAKKGCAGAEHKGCSKEQQRKCAGAGK